LIFIIQILSQFVKPPSDTLLRYFNMFHLAPLPSKSLSRVQIWIAGPNQKGDNTIVKQLILWRMQ
jgi:hypothetical protein